jgi:hypothetical protein
MADEGDEMNVFWDAFLGAFAGVLVSKFVLENLITRWTLRKLNIKFDKTAGFNEDDFWDVKDFDAFLDGLNKIEEKPAPAAKKAPVKKTTTKKPTK